MIARRISVLFPRAPSADARGFALLAGSEATVRAMLVSVWPLVLYEALGSAEAVSAAYLTAGFAALTLGVMFPTLGRIVPRRWLFTAGAGLYLVGPALAIAGGPVFAPLGLFLTGWGTVAVLVCTNAYVMDYIERHALGQSESLTLLYSALPWALGPLLGVSAWQLWQPLPFLIAMTAGALMLVIFWVMRLGNGKLIARARRPPPNPLAFLGRFFAQPRLIAGWLFAVIRSVGWWVYVVYLPIFCIEAGLGDRIASVAFSVSNSLLFLSPFMARWMQTRGLRHGVRFAFASASGFYLLAVLSGLWPPLALIGLFGASFFLVMLDTYGSLPFLMAVKPAERTEMAAVYSSFRDVSSILTPGVAWLILLVAPIPGIFAAASLALATAWAIAGNLHPRLGAPRPRTSHEFP